MTKRKRNLFLCSGISLLLIVGILCAVLLPRLAAKEEMRTFLQAAAAEDVQYLVLTDPHYKNDELFANNGKEITLSGDRLQAVRTQLLQLADGVKYKGSDKQSLTGLDLRLFAKCADGSVVQLYFQNERFYYISEDVTYYFTADAEIYATFLSTLKGAFQ